MPTFPDDALWPLATAKWAEIGGKSPDLAPAVALQRRLVRLTLDAMAGLDPGIGLDLPRASLAGKWRRGVPALRNEIVEIPPVLRDLVPSICTALAEGGAGDSALHIGAAVTAREIDAESLLRVSLARDRKAFRTSALHMGFAPDLLWLVGELASAPLAHHLQARLPAPGAAEWDRGYCPFCGSWPALIESRQGVSTLRCSFCAASWGRPTDRCVYCANAGESFIVAAPDPGAAGRRVELCGACGGYTKVVETDAPTPYPLVAIDDLATLDLDQGAMDRGYRRLDLPDLDDLEPRPPSC